MPSVRMRIWIGLGALAALGFAWAFSPRAIEVDAAYVTREDITVTVSDDGMTRVRDVFVLSAPLDGTMSRVEVEPGDEVIAGETIVSTIRPLLPPLLPGTHDCPAEIQYLVSRSRIDRCTRRCGASPGGTHPPEA